MSGRDLLVRGGALLAAVPGPVLWGCVAAGLVDPYTASYVMVVGVVVGFFCVLAGPWAGLGEGRDGSREARLLDMLVLWTIMSTCAQLGWELPFALLSSWLVGVTEHDTWAWLWWAYGIADSRYVIADPFVVVMEGFTSMVGGPLEVWTILLVRRGNLRKAALVGLCVAATQWYGTVLYFGIELFEGLVHVNTANPFDFWLKFLVLNALWLVMPLVQGFAAVTVLTRREG
ncbi:MAG: hypothetical protein H6732_06605 [Alphaproteobacteria bacterium]|nr:hypothetical protein [Alphaproteobacteria bacterium]